MFRVQDNADMGRGGRKSGEAPWPEAPGHGGISRRVVSETVQGRGTRYGSLKYPRSTLVRPDPDPDPEHGVEHTGFGTTGGDELLLDGCVFDEFIRYGLSAPVRYVK